jgi:lipopolysaccharide transport system permease protein
MEANTNNQIVEEQWTEIISSKKSWFDLKLDELWRYRDLIVLFVRRDFVAVYKQTVLGPLWHIVQPLLTTLMFTFIFGGIANIKTSSMPEGAPPHFLFFMCGVTIWNYFASCLTKTSNTFSQNADMFGKVYFPRLVVPVSNVISALLGFGIQFVMFVGFYFLYVFFNGMPFHLNMWVLAIPLFVVLMAVLGLGLGIIVSSMTTKYKDLTFLVGFGVQLYMYASPVIYPLEILSEKWQFYLSLNPIAPILEGFKYAFFGKGTFEVWMLGYSFFITIFIFLTGVMMFHKVEKTFMDTV